MENLIKEMYSPNITNITQGELWNISHLKGLRPNLKNLNRGLNLSRGSNSLNSVTVRVFSKKH